MGLNDNGVLCNTCMETAYAFFTCESKCSCNHDLDFFPLTTFLKNLEKFLQLLTRPSGGYYAQVFEI